MEKNNPGCLGSILKLFRLLPDNIKPVTETLPYAMRDDFLSPSELYFYKVLNQAIDGRGVICPKVALKDIFFVKSGDMKIKTTYLNKIDRKHIDFLVCSPESMKPIFGVELDDSSHQRSDRSDRDRFVNELFDSSGFSLLRFENKQNYSLVEVKVKIEQFHLKEGKTSKLDTVTNNQDVESEAIGSESNIPICPKCGISMIERVARTGERKGRTFYGCYNYPKCREVINL